MSAPVGGAEFGVRAGWGVLSTACLSTFVVNANTSAVSILIPSISADLGTPINVLQCATGGEPPAESLAIGLSRASIALAAFSAAGVLLALLVARRPEKPRLGDYAAATTATTHTLPTA
ncbi:hypothetical protein AB0L88_29540 [Saccharopolyspora shandongensis]|uniref:hypothetical protein n=1 Tax=Saccharopolyspora shandongensis TaxID=418495 RepID=UPI003412ADDB